MYCSLVQALIFGLFALNQLAGDLLSVNEKHRTLLGIPFIII